MWAIMVKFNRLPNDPGLNALTVEQRDWILMSMQRDNEEMQAAAKGMDLDSGAADLDENYLDDIYNNPTDEWEIMRDGQDADEIFKQVVKLTGNDEFEEKMRVNIESARTTGIDNKKAKDANVADQISDNFKTWTKIAQEREASGDLGTMRNNLKDDEDEFPEL